MKGVFEPADREVCFGPILDDRRHLIRERAPTEIVGKVFEHVSTSPTASDRLHRSKGHVITKYGLGASRRRGIAVPALAGFCKSAKNLLVGAAISDATQLLPTNHAEHFFKFIRALGLPLHEAIAACVVGEMIWRHRLRNTARRAAVVQDIERTWSISRMRWHISRM